MNPDDMKFASTVGHRYDIAGLTRAESQRFAEWLAASYADDALEAARWSDDDVAIVGATSREIGWTACEADMAEHWRRAAAGVRAVLTLPTRGELAERRELDHRPCPLRCRTCSRCQHSLAYWARGGREYRGGEAEAALAAGAS